MNILALNLFFDCYVVAMQNFFLEKETSNMNELPNTHVQLKTLHTYHNMDATL
jgi:hypothetical protein